VDCHEVIVLCLCLSDTIVELYVMDENIQQPSHWKVKMESICNKGLLNL
jgi:hypothetical protein